MKYIKLFILIASVSLFAACSDDSLDSKSIFDTQNKEEQNDFDKWLKTNYMWIPIISALTIDIVTRRRTTSIILHLPILISLRHWLLWSSIFGWMLIRK